MRYFYLSRNEMLKGQALVYDVFEIEVPLEAYRTAPDKADAIEYIGENIPNDIEYDQENDVLYSASDRPSPFHVFVKGTWIVKDKEGFKEFCYEHINELKADVLEEGFIYKGHPQRCRDKDIIFIAITALFVYLIETFLHKRIKPRWYFTDNHCGEYELTELIDLMFNGYVFVQGVYDTEHYYKTLENPSLITIDEFRDKVIEYTKRLADKGSELKNQLNEIE